jgi:hypothetical protein
MVIYVMVLWAEEAVSGDDPRLIASWPTGFSRLMLPNSLDREVRTWRLMPDDT